MEHQTSKVLQNKKRCFLREENGDMLGTGLFGFSYHKNRPKQNNVQKAEQKEIQLS